MRDRLNGSSPLLYSGTSWSFISIFAVFLLALEGNSTRRSRAAIQCVQEQQWFDPWNTSIVAVVKLTIFL
jgi:hypothetical protein